MISRPPRFRRHGAAEPELSQVQLVNKGIDDPHRIVLADVIVNALWQEKAL